MSASAEPSGGPDANAGAPDQNDADPGRMPIVALGASAGGLQALETFFDALPSDTGMAFVVLMHLSPEYESNLAAILQRHTELTVRRIEDGAVPEPNVVFVLPPKTELTIEGGQLRCAAASHPAGRPTVIDTFFRSLAANQGDKAIGIVLSGSGTDGTQGLKAVKENAGFTMVQSPEEAEHDDMPRSAIQTNLVDVVAPVERLAAELTQYWTHAARVSLPEEAEELPEEEEHLVHKILAQVYAETGHDFSGYKRSTVMRRITRRLTVNHLSSLSDYLELLRRNPEEVKTLFRELLISVTSFFRDPEHVAALEREVVPTLFEDKTYDDQVRVWCIGCATGEEAYSLAMLLHEQVEQRDRPPDIQIFATDISEQAIKTAREGLYPESVAADLTPERVKRYLKPEGAHYRVRQELREMVLFADHDLLEDPPFSKIDLVSCRNLLIYLNREMQEHVFKLFHYALRPGGTLFLGASESIGAAGGLFSDLDKQHSIYQRRPRSREDRGAPLFPLKERFAGEATPDQWRESTPQESESMAGLHQRLLMEEVASILVDENYDIVHLTDPAADYLEYQGGAPTHNVLEVAPKKLRLELRGALYQAFQKGTATEHRVPQTDEQGELQHLSVRVWPAGDGKSFAQILISEVEPPSPETDVELESETSSQHVAQLEEELHKTKEQLQATVEEYETTTEELEASNEELLSMNEELQSKNEEVETSKEELQSVNEELKTTNQELKAKIEELRRSNSDLHNLMEATDIATLFLDRDLRIERFTPRVRELFNIRATDTGRSLSDFSQTFEYDHLIKDAREVLDRLQPVEREFQTEEGRWFLVRIRPYRTVDERIDGIVLSFIDITNLKNAHRRTEREREYAANIVDTVWEPLLVLDADLRVQSANDSFYETFEVPPEETTGTLVYELGNGQWDIPKLRTLLDEILPEKTTVTNYDVEHDFEHIGRRILRLNARRVDEKQLILLAIEDVTERVAAVQQLKEERNFTDSVLDTVGALITVVDADGQIVRFNKECEAITGYASEEAENKNMFDLLIPPEDEESVRNVIEQHRQGADQTVHENHWVTKDGERRLIRWSSTVIRDDAGALEYVIGTGIDITERRQLEREVIAVSDEERRRIGENLHDMLASQLAGTAMMAEGLAHKEETEQPISVEDLRTVAELVREASKQVRTLSHSLMPLKVQGDALADGLQSLVWRQEDMNSVDCSFEKGDSVPTITGELAAHLYSIASEAVNNALKHADPSSIAVCLAVNDDHLVLSVQDDGKGIPEDTKLTDGLGLHLIQYRSELIGAQLDIEPAEDGGTLVRCSLPLKKIEQEFSSPEENAEG